MKNKTIYAITSSISIKQANGKTISEDSPVIKYFKTKENAEKYRKIRMDTEV